MSLQVPDNRSTLPIKKPVFQASTPAAKREEIKCGEDNFARVQRFHMAAKNWQTIRRVPSSPDVRSLELTLINHAFIWSLASTGRLPDDENTFVARSSFDPFGARPMN
jgi:hypothetical protein